LLQARAASFVHYDITKHLLNLGATHVAPELTQIL
jgi:hypothetical protein